MLDNRIVLGTRGSELARAQTRLVECELSKEWPELLVDTKIIKTSGDRRGATFHVANPETSQVGNLHQGRKGIFTREIEEALRRREIDVAVHSAKDLPSNSPSDLHICATLARAATDDVLLMKNVASLKSLRHGATIVTGSVRRKHQLQWRRMDLRILELRGNVPTRLRKFIEGDWDAIVLARAGLERLGYDLSERVLNFERHSLNLQLLSSEDFLPAGGQGVIAMQVRRDDESTRQRVLAINHAATFLCLRAEREFLRLLQVDCNAPVGVLGTIEGPVMTFRAQVFEQTKEEPKTGEVRLPLAEWKAEAIAAALHTQIYGQS